MVRMEQLLARECCCCSRDLLEADKDEIVSLELVRDAVRAAISLDLELVKDR